MNRSSYTFGIMLVAASAIAFGIMPVFIKMAYASGASVYTTLFLRFLFATILIFPIMAVRKVPMLSRRETITFLLLGAIGYVAQALFYYLALVYTTVSVAALIFYIYPALVVVGSVLVFKEVMTLQKVIALVFALVGAAVVSLGQLDANLLGAGFSLASSISYTIYILVNARVAQPGKGIQAAAFIILGATIVFGCMNLVVGFTPPATPQGYVAIAIIGAISTAFAFWSFLTGLEIIGPSATSIISTLEPVTAVVSSVLILGEPLTPNIVIGGIFVIAALLVTTWSSNNTSG